MKIGALGWCIAVLAVFVLAVNIVQEREASGYHRAKRERLEAISRAAEHALDTLKARHAEQAIRWQKGNDSLRRIVATVRGRPPLIIRDTVQMPVAEYVYITDTLLPACTLCAARLDSAVLAARAEREAATLLHRSQETRLQWWVAHDKPHHSLRTKLRERIGFTLGYGVTSAGGQVYVGPQVGVSIRMIP